MACIANRACINGEWVNVLRSFSSSRDDVVYGYVLTVFTIYYYTEADKQKLTTEFIINMHDFLSHYMKQRKSRLAIHHPRDFILPSW